MATFTFDNTNTDGVNNGPQPFFFGVAQPTFIRRIFLYFYNQGQGAAPAMVVYIRQVPGVRPGGLPDPSSPYIWFGPFATVLSDGQRAHDSNVEIFPNIVIPPGRYEVVPTEPAKWSFNARSGNQGFTRVEGDLAPPVAAGATNQNQPAYWAVGKGQPQKICWFQPTLGQTSYVAIYRITNSESSSLATIQTAGGSFTLQPGGSVDISSPTIDIQSTGSPAWGTFQDICCSLGVLQAPSVTIKKDGGSGSPPPDDPGQARLG